MHKRGTYIWLFVLLVAASSCSVRRFLPAGEKLYKGSTIIVHANPEVKTKKAALKSSLKLAVTPRRNKFILGQPYKVWWWYVIGEPNPNKPQKGLRSFLRKQLAEPPVLSSKVNAPVTAENMASYMENIGYFHTTVQGDTVHSGYFVKSVYTANVQPQYFIKSISWVSDSSALLGLLEKEQQQGLVKAGQAYRLSDISSERDRLDLYLKTKGYYFFNPDYLMAYVDSTVGNRQVELFFNLKRSTPEMARHPYRIDSMMVYPNYSLASGAVDTGKRFTAYDGLLIRDKRNSYKPRLFARTITYRPGSIYDSREQNSSLNRFINLGAFKFVKNRFEAVQDSPSLHRLNVYYYLTAAKKKSLQAEINGFSKENNALGALLSVNWKNRNVFRGAEQLMVKAYTGFELSFADSVKNNNSYRIGAEASIRFPRYAIPFIRIKENNFYPPSTNLLLGYELFRKQLFYTKNLFRLQYDFTWKKNIRNEFTLAPVSLSYLNASSVTDSFNKQVLLNPNLIVNIYSEAILGSFFSYTYNNGLTALKNKWYFSSSIDLSGNIAGLVTGAKNFREKMIFNTPFAQYVKLDADLHYTRALGNKWDLANRLQVGIGIPYNNSRLLPFSKQYSIGGSSSIRGFRVRNLGPGSYKPTAEDQRAFQLIGGDFKLLFNTELRFPIAGKLSGAIFADAGNVWTKDSLLFGEAAKLSRNWFKELAVASGIGLRYDLSILVLRVDIGIPLRKPYLPDGQRWVIKQIDPWNNTWQRENLILNIALGMPF